MNKMFAGIIVTLLGTTTPANAASVYFALGVLPIGNVHPNTAGYTAIAGAVSAAGAVPEPAVWLILIVGFGVIGSAQRLRRRAGVVA
ncbi:MAG: PEPxxWA-CTERM sorting domain-containing protein [Janthinobacterium lividum]